jgi:hypothetical protein
MGGLLSMLARALDCGRPGNKEAGGMTGLASLAALEGRWHLARRIVNADGSEAALEGTTVFRRAGLRLIQEEEGWLRLPGGGAALRATRRYLWTVDKARLDVFFEDNRPFHSVPLGVDRPEAAHFCDPDRYAVAYDFTGWPLWRSVWRVEGPRKDYVMTSDYRPA